jgi:hypothetical protein
MNKPYDKAFAAIIKWLREHGYTAHTDRYGHTEMRRKRQAVDMQNNGESI